MSNAPEPFALADAAAVVLAERTGVPSHDVVLVLGSGWAAAADGLGEVVADVQLDELPGFPAPTVLGHRNSALSIRVGGTNALVLGGRVHLYEGHPAATVVHGVRTAIAAGCGVVVLTNAAGGLNPDWPVGQPVLIADQLNLTGASPMAGPAPPVDRPIRFTDLTEAYSSRLRALALDVDPTLPEGVYAGLLGGAFETPAEIRMMAGLGADLVGMSTVLETIAARHLGVEVLGISLVTNAAAGMGDTDLDHEDVLEAAAEAGPRMLALLRGVLERL
ncbi:MAG: purine-nucleoside phosphorylase [Acidimicrobiales bacterium]|jgi:purine-nucleoside phosphorylase|nr:purine-nucleoside phosphorylase [Acidimicrobiaceae bacterium]MDP6492934.1 purine-nucleoside phosphorylase [Acidimicrobiales bacterium]MDP6649147.1 purine-nucleoside phosphorylase [Acidimicrobiales bacterium]MDP6758921.1 purine-nucleoside phosphorylase [Acidimicrobiales bacterium]|tara:strand:- start:13553 stop:14380 length:828 start_codon:yes stop_codon:yes gene_type:complete